MYRLTLAILLLVALALPVTAQDSLNVTFRYTPNENALRSFVPGSFNNWGNNSSGAISTTDESLLTEDTENGFSYQVIRLRVGGGAVSRSGVNGYAYKFHEQYSIGNPPWAWFTDPLNPLTVGANSDSFLEVTSPLIFQVFPAQNSVHQIDPPALIANIASIDSDPVNTSSSTITVNGQDPVPFGDFYEDERQLLLVPSLSDLGAEVTSGANTIRLDVVTTSGQTREQTITFNFIEAPEPVRAARPDGLHDGITVDPQNPGSVSFSMFAPGKRFVHLIGDHSNWEVDDAYLLNMHEVNADSVHFWITLDGLADGEYRFQYLVDGDIRIADLFSELVLDPNNDRFITEAVYPDMPQYPAGQTTGMVSVFEIGREPFNWQSNDYQRPPQDELIIYELLLRDFVEESTFEVLKDTLDYLDRLGINAIELMPVSNFDGNLSWGYNPNFHGALDKSYGTRESFKRFIDEAHSRGIAVILDVVYNHTQEASPLVALYGTDPATNRFLGPGHEFNVFRHLNHNDSYVRYWMDRTNRHWIENFRIDGYRFDLTKGFATNFNSTNYNGYNSQRIGNLKRMADAIWSYEPDAYVILEHFAADSEERELAHYRTDEPEINGMMFWQNMTTPFQEAAMGYVNPGANLSGIWYENRGWSVPNAISYMESHDEQWMMLKNLRFGNRSGDYDIRQLPTALERQQLAGAFFYMIPGPRMMWQFGELGYGGGPGECLKPGGGDGDCSATDPGRTAEKPIRWDYYADPDRYELYQVWSALINLRREHPVFHDVNTQVITTLNPSNYRQVQLIHDTMSATIAGNFGVTPRTASVLFPSTGTWYDYMSGEPFEVTSTTMSVEMAPGQFNIYTTEPLPVPDIIRATSVESGDAIQLPSQVQLYQNFPNPFNPSTTVRFDLPATASVSLSVYDVLGRQVAVLVDDTLPAGTHSVNFDAQQYSSGTYLIRLQTGSHMQTRTMMLIK
ncbi:MAG: extracellular 1,4-alpha-glucan branching enzyme [Bacteroidetes bacterium HLUCCA01]|nr:MAG: extracellular 1,4-alpha-glucan branching enzyme [Bacteroidetes bacterium HLUCCA01]